MRCCFCPYVAPPASSLYLVQYIACMFQLNLIKVKLIDRMSLGVDDSEGHAGLACRHTTIKVADMVTLTRYTTWQSSLCGSQQNTYAYYNSSPIDEPGNRCQESLVEAPCKYEAPQGGFHGDPVSRNQPCQQAPTSTVTLNFSGNTYLTQYLSGSDFQKGLEGQGSKFTSERMQNRQL